jgi:adenosylhomocysteine nucleosidase
MAAPLGILCALPQEREVLLAATRGPTPLPGADLEAWSGRLDGRPVAIATSGVGKVNAAITATLLVERLGCRALVLSGVAGGLSTALDVGDLVVADRLIDVDYGRLTETGRIAYQPGRLPLPGVDPEPGYRLPSELARSVHTAIAEAGVAATVGTVLCGDAFLASGRVRDELAARWSALAIEMEGAGVCGAAERLGIPWLIVRALSDRAGEESVRDFAAFLDAAAAASANLVRVLSPVFDT